MKRIILIAIALTVIYNDNGCVNGEITVSKIENYEKGELTDVYRLSDVAREELGVWDLDKEVA